MPLRTSYTSLITLVPTCSSTAATSASANRPQFISPSSSASAPAAQTGTIDAVSANGRVISTRFRSRRPVETASRDRTAVAERAHRGGPARPVRDRGVEDVADLVLLLQHRLQDRHRHAGVGVLRGPRRHLVRRAAEDERVHQLVRDQPGGAVVVALPPGREHPALELRVQPDPAHRGVRLHGQHVDDERLPLGPVQRGPAARSRPGRAGSRRSRSRPARARPRAPPPRSGPWRSGSPGSTRPGGPGSRRRPRRPARGTPSGSRPPTAAPGAPAGTSAPGPAPRSGAAARPATARAGRAAGCVPPRSPRPGRTGSASGPAAAAVPSRARR